MIAASRPVQRPADARLLTVDPAGSIRHRRRDALLSLLREGDIVIANDAATLPASLRGTHLPTGLPIEIRLAARASMAAGSIAHVSAVVFGDGDFRSRTEDRPPPPPLAPGDRLRLGPLSATIERLLDHPRLADVVFDGSAPEIWEGLARHGRPIQYSHLAEPLAIWDSWTPIAGPPVAFEPPSAGFVLDWRLVAAFASRGIHFATLTHAAGISSTGDAALDARLPFDEPYRIPESTARLVNEGREEQRVIAVGTSVVRALEGAAANGGGRIVPGDGIATNRLGAGSRLRVVRALLSGTHEPGTSHYELLRAFTSDVTLRRMDAELNRLNYRTHEFGDSIFIESGRGRQCAFVGSSTARPRACDEFLPDSFTSQPGVS